MNVMSSMVVVPHKAVPSTLIKSPKFDKYVSSHIVTVDIQQASRMFPNTS